MTNHIHVLATPDSGHAISQVLQSVGRRYVQYFNAAYGRSGALWEGATARRWWTASGTC